MKYSVHGELNMSDGAPIVSVINKYTLWKLDTGNHIDPNNADIFGFEAWVNTPTDKDNLFNELKLYVDQNTGFVNWHNCTHDEPVPQPCTVAETYRK